MLSTDKFFTLTTKDLVKNLMAVWLTDGQMSRQFSQSYTCCLCTVVSTWASQSVFLVHVTEMYVSTEDRHRILI